MINIIISLFITLFIYYQFIQIPLLKYIILKNTNINNDDDVFINQNYDYYYKFYFDKLKIYSVNYKLDDIKLLQKKYDSIIKYNNKNKFILIKSLSKEKMDKLICKLVNNYNFIPPSEYIVNNTNKNIIVKYIY